MPYRYERLGVRERWATKVRMLWEPMLAEWSPGSRPLELLGGNYCTRIFGLTTVAIGYYLMDDTAKTAHWGRCLVGDVQEYFFGEWRKRVPDNPHHPEEAGFWPRGQGMWVKPFRAGAAFALGLGDWPSAQRLAAHPTDDKSDPTVSLDEREWHLLLAEYLARGATAAFADRLAKVKGKTRYWDRATALEAISRGDGSVAGRCWAEAMKGHIRYDVPKGESDYLMAFDETILYFIAVRANIDLGISDAWRDRLIILQ